MTPQRAALARTALLWIVAVLLGLVAAVIGLVAALNGTVVGWFVLGLAAVVVVAGAVRIKTLLAGAGR